MLKKHKKCIMPIRDLREVRLLGRSRKRPESGSFVLIWVNFDLSSRITILCMTIIKFDKFLFGNAQQSYQTSNSLIRVRMLPIRCRSLLPFIHYTF